MGPPPKTSPPSCTILEKAIRVLWDFFPMPYGQCLAILLNAAILPDWHLTIWITGCRCSPLFWNTLQNSNSTKRKRQEKKKHPPKWPWTCANPPVWRLLALLKPQSIQVSFRALDRSLSVQFFVLQSVLRMGRWACNFLCSKACFGWVVERATFCAPKRAPDRSLSAQLFVLQSVLRMGRWACNFLCSKACSGWVVERATFCAPKRAPDRSLSVQLFVLQSVLRMGRWACNFLCSKACSGWVVERATFCAPKRAPDRSLSVQLFVLQSVLRMDRWACNFCAPKRAPDRSLSVQLFVLQSVLRIGRWACNFLCSKACSGLCLFLWHPSGRGVMQVMLDFVCPFPATIFDNFYRSPRLLCCDFLEKLPSFSCNFLWYKWCFFWRF